ncbi:MAG: hypothetical protein ACLR0U_20225 [Enterocloster clostridioformis]
MNQALAFVCDPSDGLLPPLPIRPKSIRGMKGPIAVKNVIAPVPPGPAVTLPRTSPDINVHNYGTARYFMARRQRRSRLELGMKDGQSSCIHPVL